MQKERCCKGCLKENNSKEEEIFYPSPLAGGPRLTGKRPGEGYTKKDITEQGNNFVDYPSSVCSDSVRQTTSPARGEVKQLGFTLIELLVVVLIIGILAAVALPKYNMAIARARMKQSLALGRAFQTAQKVYFLANGEYADNFDELDIDFPAPTSSQLEVNGDYKYLSYRYPWGTCTLRCLDGGVVDMHCKVINTVNLEIKLDAQDTIYCLAHSSNDFEMKLCRLETGKTMPDIENTGWGLSYYKY